MVILIALSSLFFTNPRFRQRRQESMDDEGRLCFIFESMFHVRMAGYGTLLSSK